MKVGAPHPNANEISTILTKTRSCIASLNPVNKSGKVSRKEIENSLSINANSDSETNVPSQESKFLQSLEEVIMLVRKFEHVRAKLSNWKSKSSLSKKICSNRNVPRAAYRCEGDRNLRCRDFKTLESQSRIFRDTF